MTGCKWDREAEDYLTDDGTPCRRDDYGDPTRHCTSRRTCSQHVGEGELTCARCLSRTRTDIRQIVERAALMLPEAMVTGLREAAWLAAPGADPRGWSEQRLAEIGHLDHWLAIGRIKVRQYVHARGTIDDDEYHPYNVLTRWHMMLAEDYGLTLPAKMTIANSADFLARIVGRVAQDPDQDFRLFRYEMRTCRSHLEAVLHDSLAPEKGAPCPACVESGKVDPAKVRLVRNYSHWCDDEDCTEQFHSTTDDFDTWVCPRNREHWWTAAGYGELVDGRKGA